MHMYICMYIYVTCIYILYIQNVPVNILARLRPLSEWT